MVRNHEDKALAFDLLTNDLQILRYVFKNEAAVAIEDLERLGIQWCLEKLEEVLDEYGA